MYKLLLFATCILHITCLSQNTGTNSNALPDSLLFRSLSMNDALTSSPNKKIFIYFHIENCTPCLKMKKTTFKDPGVIKLYHNNFTIIDFDGKKGEGIELAKKYQVSAYPTFVFTDEKGKMEHKIAGYFNSAEFMDEAGKVIDNSNTLKKLKEEYPKKSKDKYFMYTYSVALAKSLELDSLVASQYLDLLTKKDLLEEKNINFIYQYAIIEGTPSFSATHTAFDFLLSNSDKFYQYFEKEQVDIRIIWIVNRTAYKMITQKNKEEFLKCLDILKRYDNNKSYLLKDSDGNTIGMSMAGRVDKVMEQWNKTNGKL